MKAICRIDFVTALLLLIINCMFLFKEYEKQLNLKEPIKVRTKKLVNGCQSIYLDIYMNGRRQYEFLKLYIIPEHNQADKKEMSRR